MKRFFFQRKVFLIVALSAVSIGLVSVVFADPAHDAGAPADTGKTDRVALRTVGDTDPDNISAEGLGSFYGEVISNDIASVHASREGVISSWNVAIGDDVFAGATLGYVTVVGISSEQQQRLAEQQAAAEKAQLDFVAAERLTEKTRTVFSEITARAKTTADRERALFNPLGGAAADSLIVQSAALEAKKKLFDGKIGDFAAASLSEIYQEIGTGGVSPLADTFSSFRVQPGIGLLAGQLLIDYEGSYFMSYARSVRQRTVSAIDIQNFLNTTATLLSMSAPTEGGLTPTELKEKIVGITALQTDFRELSDIAAQATVDKASNDRERYQIDIDLAKRLSDLDNDLALQSLDMEKARVTAENEAAGARILAQKLAVSAGGVVPIVASRSGIVAAINKNVGSYVAVSDEIGLISTKAPKKFVRFTIPPAWNEIRKGDSMAVSWRPNFATVEGILKGISPLLNDKGGHQAELTLPAGTSFPVGSSVSIVPSASKRGVFVNRKAVQFEQVNPFVWIVTEEKILRKQGVVPGRQLGEYVEIKSGLERGFQYLIVLDESLALETGMKLDAILSNDIKAVAPSPAGGSAVQDESQPHAHD